MGSKVAINGMGKNEICKMGYGAVNAPSHAILMQNGPGAGSDGCCCTAIGRTAKTCNHVDNAGRRVHDKRLTE